jgi:hypothetical protein
MSRVYWTGEEPDPDVSDTWDCPATPRKWPVVRFSPGTRSLENHRRHDRGTNTMSEQFDAERRDFANERSHKDAASSSDTARTTAQSAILVNGGAATAVLALLSKNGLEKSILNAAAISLSLYALGVTMGVFMMYCSVRSLELFATRWRFAADPEKRSSEQEHLRWALRWLNWWRGAFYASMLLFIISSLLLAMVMFLSNKGTAPAPAPPPPPSATAPRASTTR